MTDTLLIVVTALVGTTLIVVLIVAFRQNRTSGDRSISPDHLSLLLRHELGAFHGSTELDARTLRQEITSAVKGVQDSVVQTIGIMGDGAGHQIRSFGDRFDTFAATIESRVSRLGEKVDNDLFQLSERSQRDRDDLRADIEGRFDSAATKQSDAARSMRDELGQSFHRMSGNIVATLTEQGDRQRERLDIHKANIETLSDNIVNDINKTHQINEHSIEIIRTLIEGRMGDLVAQQMDLAKGLREELGQNFQRLGGNVSTTLNEMSESQRERLDNTKKSIDALSEQNTRSSENLRKSVEERLDAMRQENASKLEEMRQTVDEKLHSTLETRLGESFNKVVEHLSRVHEGLGEMRSLASNVGDLKSVLSNVKIRGTFGEVQLEMLLEQFLTPDQYIKNAKVKEGSSERVEFAIKLPGKGDGSEVLLPIDAKFPRETFDRLIESSQEGDEEKVRNLRKSLEGQIRAFAREISLKYINTPVTTDFAILFLPTEGLYAEALRMTGLFEVLQREYKITLAGPTTLSAILNAFQMGFRSLAIEKRSSEVWHILGAVQTEFKKYNEVVDKLGNQLNTAARSVESLGTRTRAMNRRLRTVQSMPEGTSAATLLGLEEEESEGGSERIFVAIKETSASLPVSKP